MQSAPFPYRVRRIASVPNAGHPQQSTRSTPSSSGSSPADRSRTLITVKGDQGHPHVWGLCKSGTVMIRDGFSGEVVFEFSTKGSFPRCAIEVPEFSEVWIGHADGLVRVFQSHAPYELVDDVYAANPASGGCYHLSLGEAEESSLHQDRLQGPGGAGNTDINDTSFGDGGQSDIVPFSFGEQGEEEGNHQSIAAPVFVAFGDNSIHCYDSRTRALCRRLQGHTGIVRCLAYHNDILYSGAEDGYVLAWEGNASSTSTHPNYDNEVFSAAKDIISALCISRKQMISAEVLWVGTDQGHVKAINLDSNVVIKVAATAGNAAVTSIRLIENVVTVSTRYTSALRFDGTTGEQLASLAVAQGSDIPSTHLSPAHRQSSRKYNDGGVLDVTEVGNLQVNVLWALSGRNTFSTFRQESFDRLDVAALITKRKSTIEQQVRELRATVAAQQQRLQVRLNPPEDTELTAAVTHSRRVARHIVHNVASHHEVQVKQNHHHKRRHWFTAWWIATIARKLRRREVAADRCARDSAKKVLGPFWQRWSGLGEKSAAKLKNNEYAARLASDNTQPIAARYFASWAKFRVYHGAMSLVAASTKSGQKVFLKPYFIALREWRLRVKQQRRRSVYANTLMRTTTSGLMHLYFSTWQHRIVAQRQDAARRTFISTIAGHNDSMMRRLYFSKWERGAAIKKQKKISALSKTLFLSGFSSVTRRYFFHQWMKLVHRRRHATVIHGSANIFKRCTTHGLLTAYFVRWRQTAKLKLATSNKAGQSESQKAITGAAGTFIAGLSKEGLQREYFKHWVTFAEESLARHRQIRAIEVLLQGSASGTMRLMYTRWTHYVQYRRHTRSKMNIRGTFLRSFNTGVQSIYFQKLMKFAAMKKKVKLNKKLFQTMSVFSDNKMYSKYFQQWLKKVIVKQQLRFTLQVMTVPPDDCFIRYFRKWAHWFASKSIRSRIKSQKAKLDRQQELARLEQQSEELTRAISMDKWELHNLITERSGVESQFRSAQTAAADREAQLHAEMDSNDTQLHRLEVMKAKRDRYRTVISSTRNKPPVKVAGKWLNDWREVEKMARALRSDVSDDTLPLKRTVINARLEDIARRAVAAHRVIDADVEVMRTRLPPPLDNDDDDEDAGGAGLTTTEVSQIENDGHSDSHNGLKVVG